MCVYTHISALVGLRALLGLAGFLRALVGLRASAGLAGLLRALVGLRALVRLVGLLGLVGRPALNRLGLRRLCLLRWPGG
jgi:hypothetical protein